MNLEANDKGATDLALVNDVSIAGLAESSAKQDGLAQVFMWKRNQAVELLRIVSAFGIVAFHAGARGGEVAYSGLIVFVMLSPLFEVENWSRARSPISLGRTLLMPWIFWTIAFGAVNVARHKPFVPEESGWLAGLLYGAAPHLWFLPFMFVVLLILGQVKRRISPLSVFVFSLVFTSGLLIATIWWRPWALEQGYPVAQWVHATPAVFAGMAIGLARSVSFGRSGINLIILSLIIAAAENVPGVSVPYTVGTLLVLLTSWFGARFAPSHFGVEPISRCMMGVYLVHPFWLAAARPLTNRLDYLGVTTAFIGSFVSVWLARRLIPASKIVLG